MRARSLLSAAAVAVSMIALQAAEPAATPAVHVRSTPENVVLGVFPIDRAPVAKVASGAVVRIDTLSQRGATQQEDPVMFLGKFGVKPDEILQDVKDLWAARNAKPASERGGGGHILTGPIYVEGAEPGDTLAVEMIELTTRVPYGINSTSSTSGVFSASYPGAQGDPIPVTEIPNTNHLIRTGVENGRAVAFFADNIRVPMHPFFGTMAVAPEHPTVGQPGVRVEGLQTSGPPGPYGGNMDFRDLKAGSTLYLPVFHRGALFYVGDPHGTQGDGEVSGNAIEQSLTGVLRFTVLKGKTLRGPRAEDATHYYVMGIDLDLDRAMRKSVAETVDFLVKEKGLTPAKALSLCSIAIDFRIAEVVDTTQVVVGSIPKALFR
ncbi:MAG TPA: acetamidase/formamidase family protein [Vicinamibacterales bacterium]|nr:acetamidase/formamidase family protein [Vicinamibacterales bacterium]